METARHGDDADALALAEAEWEHVTRLARTHGMTIGSPEAGPGEADPVTGSGAIYETHFNEHRPYRSLGQAAPLRALTDPVEGDIKVIRRDRLGGLIHEYAQVA
ncbi:hypothetical protein ACFSKW_34790 [Nonomuraea mangrovi]|uniref:Uncharacterized protein n=1 Tax=Nonomuraea mangrovi TaxID=2316207 RepID=A0ABW4T5L3_9ACTN